MNDEQPWPPDLATFLGSGLIIEDAALNAEMLRCASSRLTGFETSAREAANMREIPNRHRPDLVFVGFGGPVRFVLDRQTRNPVYAARLNSTIGPGASVFPWTIPEARGRGIASEALWMRADRARAQIPITSYTMAGLRTRIAAHALLLNRHEGPLPEGAANGYERGNEGAWRLAEPFSVEGWNQNIVRGMVSDGGGPKRTLTRTINRHEKLRPKSPFQLYESRAIREETVRIIRDLYPSVNKPRRAPGALISAMGETRPDEQQVTAPGSCQPSPF